MINKHENRQLKLIAIITLLLPLAGVGLLLSWIPANLPGLIKFSEENSLLGPIIVIIWRILAIVIPPLPGEIVSLTLIPVFGWQWSFVYASIGILSGSSIAFLLARQFREPLVQRFVPLQQLHKWQEKLSGKPEFLAFLGIRLTTWVILDFISYVAGISKISYGKFLIVTLIVSFTDIPLYWIGGEAYRSSIYLGFALIVLFLLIYYFAKKRLLEKK